MSRAVLISRLMQRVPLSETKMTFCQTLLSNPEMRSRSREDARTNLLPLIEHLCADRRGCHSHTLPLQKPHGVGPRPLWGNCCSRDTFPITFIVIVL
ncbi:hypothetical protein TNCV_1286811 [Trichonephila clavipes]|nr:hypothetical protein TNCV_1286811 [Trichonephila clavipes]